MALKKPYPRQRCINYKQREAPYFQKIEERLCEEFGYSISQLHKESIREKFNNWMGQQVKQKELEMI